MKSDEHYDMRPTDGSAPDADAVAEGSADFDEWRALQRSTNKKRADILTDIVGHPKGSPSVEELDYMNPSLSDDAIRRHLDRLKEVGVVKMDSFEKGDRVGGYPYQFFSVTAQARELFDKNGLFPVAAWKREYAAVEKTPRIKELESMPRPEE